MQEFMRYLRFDDKRERDQKLKNDKLAAVREIYELVVEKFKSSYNPSQNLTVDERISPFKGRVGFKVFMPNKPQKYGIKLWMLCDAENYFVSNFKIYSGKVGNLREVNQGENVVMDLTSHLNAGYNITVDNFFTSIPLALKLLGRKNPMTLLGTLRSNRKYIPSTIKSHSKKEEYSSKFCFSEDCMIVSYIPKKDKSVILLSSSEPNTEVIDDEKRKPEVILEYNKTKFGVDKLDEITKSTTCIRGTRRWTLNVFYNILDMICYNSYVSYNIGRNKKTKRRDFLIELSKILCQTYAAKRITVPAVPTNVKLNIKKFFAPNEPIPLTPKREKPKKNEKCDFCMESVDKYKDRKNALDFCSSCCKKVCLVHQQATKCNMCS